MTDDIKEDDLVLETNYDENSSCKLCLIQWLNVDLELIMVISNLCNEDNMWKDKETKRKVEFIVYKYLN